MVCKLCGHSYDFYKDAICRQCPKCYYRYKIFRDELPEAWKKLMGYTSLLPNFDEWQEEQLIKKRLFDGKITEEQAKKEAQAFAEKIRKHYIPTSQELMVEMAEREAKREKSLFDIPSLF